jgi:hypothetical protein
MAPQGGRQRTRRSLPRKMHRHKFCKVIYQV